MRIVLWGGFVLLVLSALGIGLSGVMSEHSDSLHCYDRAGRVINGLTCSGDEVTSFGQSLAVFGALGLVVSIVVISIGLVEDV